jgi:hypothetical protein
MAPLMNDHTNLASTDKPKLYYGVRKCDSLEGPAIFLNWKDCKLFVGSEKDDTIEYQSFERIADATRYVTFQQVVYDRPDFSLEAGASSLTLLKRSVDQASLSSSAGSTKKRLPEILSLDASSVSNDNPERTEPVDLDIDLLRSDSADGDHATDSSTTDGLESSHRTSAPVFERHLEHLKEYINVHGTASVVAADCCEERFMGLNRFVVDWRFNARNIAKGRAKPSSNTFAKIRQLIDLGVDLGVDPKSFGEPGVPASNDHCLETATQVTLGKPRGKPSQAFERSFQLLQEYKQTYGTTVLSAANCQGKFKTVRPFLSRLRSERARQGKAHQSSATESRIRRLVSLGFLCEEEELQTQASTDACTTEDQQGAPGKPKRARFSPAFERDFQLLKEYKDTYGTTVLLAEHSQGKFQNLGRFQGLSLFLRTWRAKADRFLMGTTEITHAEETKILQLVNLGVDLEHRTGWGRNFNLLLEYKAIEGSSPRPRSLHQTTRPIEKFRHLHVWCQIQHTQIRMYQCDHAISTLDESQYNRLMMAGFSEEEGQA